jgi:hypothetical protein
MCLLKVMRSGSAVSTAAAVVVVAARSFGPHPALKIKGKTALRWIHFMA